MNVMSNNKFWNFWKSGFGVSNGVEIEIIAVSGNGLLKLVDHG